ncbi:MAG: cell division protein SepF [Candidatus Bathyarchaeota archaeon]|nr:cell division protein SepF [Candidatus Bathyarchaeota archaeon]
MQEETSPADVPEQNEAEVTYLRAMPLRDLSDLDYIKAQAQKGNIIIIRITPLANKSIEEVKQAINELYSFVENINGDIARLGEERIVVCPQKIRIWREKTPAQNQPLPTTT